MANRPASVGPSVYHSFDGIERYANERDTAKYVELVESNASAENFRDTIDHASESAFLGLRLNDGIGLADYEARYGVDLAEKIAGLEVRDLIEIDGGRLRLTRKGMLFSNEVFAALI